MNVIILPFIKLHDNNFDYSCVPKNPFHETHADKYNIDLSPWPRENCHFHKTKRDLTKSCSIRQILSQSRPWAVTMTMTALGKMNESVE